jgi:hypothetical protein
MDFALELLVNQRVQLIRLLSNLSKMVLLYQENPLQFLDI